MGLPFTYVHHARGRLVLPVHQLPGSIASGDAGTTDTATGASLTGKIGGSAA